MARPFTRRQARENARFLAMLARTGNARLAARELGVHRSTYGKRRARCAAFAAGWDAALRAAGESLGRAGEAPPLDPPDPCRAGLRTEGGEPVLVRLRDGRLQLRRARPGGIADQAEALFLGELARTGNVRHAAAAAGVAHSSFLARCRTRPGFAEAAARAVAEAREALARRMSEPVPPLPEEDWHWPRGLTVAQALWVLQRYSGTRG